jgi:hypothetical protein
LGDGREPGGAAHVDREPQRVDQRGVDGGVAQERRDRRGGESGAAGIHDDRGVFGVHREGDLDPRLLGVLALGLVSHYVPEAWYQRALGGFASLPALAQAAVLVVLALTVREMASLEAVPFVYFQF